jgi:hypothetical protein
MPWTSASRKRDPSGSMRPYAMKSAGCGMASVRVTVALRYTMLLAPTTTMPPTGAGTAMIMDASESRFDCARGPSTKSCAAPFPSPKKKNGAISQTDSW